jgi:hypothetical protein
MGGEGLPPTMRHRGSGAALTLVVVAVLLLLGPRPAAAATSAGCQVLGEAYPGIGNSSHTPIFPPPPNITNAAVVQLFGQFCSTPAFGQALSLHGSSAFGLQAGGNYSSGLVAVDFFFQWQSTCPPAVATAGPCTFQETWVGWPTNGSTAGPTTTDYPSICMGCPSPAGTPVSLVGIGLGVGVGVAVVVALMVWRRRRHHPAKGTPANRAVVEESPRETGSR